MNSLHVAACAPISPLKGGGDKSERCPIEITYIAELETDNPPWFTIMSDLFNAFERTTTAVFFSLEKDQVMFKSNPDKRWLRRMSYRQLKILITATLWRLPSVQVLARVATEETIRFRFLSVRDITRIVRQA